MWSVDVRKGRLSISRVFCDICTAWSRMPTAIVSISANERVARCDFPHSEGKQACGKQASK